MGLEARLAGITCLSLGGRGPKAAYLFEPHRLALPSWAHAAPPRPATLVTLDRHFDLVAPVKAPPPGWSVLDYDRHARLELDERNVDHILAAMEAGLIGDAIVVARAAPTGAFTEDRYVDQRGGVHQLIRVPTLERLLEDFGQRGASNATSRARAALESGAPTFFDIDLDCFTSPSDADPFMLVPWPRRLIREFLCLDAKEFWEPVLSPCLALTIALEPKHCGGVIAAHQLFAEAAPVVFQELLATDLP